MMRTYSLGLVLAVLTGVTHASSSSSIGTTDAVRCYEESRLPLSSQSVRYCDEAIGGATSPGAIWRRTLSNRGIILASNGKYREALEDHNQAIDMAPSLAQAYVNRGNTHYHMRDFETAITDFDRAIELRALPRHAPYYNKSLALLKLGAGGGSRGARKGAGSRSGIRENQTASRRSGGPLKSVPATLLLTAIGAGIGAAARIGV
ncbi:MAG: tetratricopeptide repeat protein [Gammaproteobacteria bacterium]|nr:tetratricopeptide repeat protein [Gammaproteobacteria bacterium]